MRRLILWIALLLTAACNSAEPTVTPAPTATQPPTATAQIGVNFVTRAPPTQAVLQVTPTPLPTATATPSPTPIVYAVTEGDTVWSIAYGNRTTPDELLALNPNVRPELMSIGDELILPPPATAIAQAEIGTSVPLAIQVVSAQLYQTPAGSAWVMGEVENLGAVSAENIKVAINLVDSSGEIVTSAEAWVAASIVKAGENAPFAVLLREFSGEDINLVTSIVSGNSIGTLGTRYLDLAIADDFLSLDDNEVRISGNISNTGDITATVSLLATLIDYGGNVVGFTQILLDDVVLAGDSAEFSLTLTPLTNPVAEYRLIAIGQTAK